MSRNTFDRKGVLRAHLTYEKSGTITKGTHENAVGSVTAGLMKVAADGEHVRGIIRAVESDGVTAQVRGIVSEPVLYSGSAPTAGEYNLLLADGSLGVKVDAGGHPFFVESVDVGNTTCIIDLG